jgi:hypothetical protein
MHYYEDPQSREKKLTRDFVYIHQSTLCQVLGLSQGDKVVVEFQKSRYGASGDVDIAVWKNPNSENEKLIGIEVKSLFLEEVGEFKSEKLLKHNKQIKALEKEGWDYVYLFDFIVTKPASGWFHPQAFEGYDNYRKTVESEKYGHVVFQINAIAGKPESMAGSISHKILQEAKAHKAKDGRLKIVEAFKSFDFSSSSVIVDSV